MAIPDSVRKQYERYSDALRQHRITRQKLLTETELLLLLFKEHEIDAFPTIEVTVAVLAEQLDRLARE